LIEKYGDPKTARLDWKAKDEIDLDIDQAQKISRLVDALEDNDDVQLVCGNYTISDEVAQQLD
jgi:transcriptional/translational regulatory protein YebC/TACO1